MNQKICPKARNGKCESPCSYHSKMHDALNACNMNTSGGHCPHCVEVPLIEVSKERV